MRVPILPLALGLAASPLAAQETRPAIPILIRSAEPKQEPAAPAGSFAALEQEFRRARDEWMAGYRAAAAEGEDAARRYLEGTPRPEPGFVQRFRDAAQARAGTPEAAPFLNWLVGMDREQAAAHARVLIGEHLADQQLAAYLRSLQYAAIDADEKLRLLSMAIDGSPHDAVKMQARYLRGLLHMQREGEEARAAAKADLVAVAEGGDAAVAARAKGELFELEHLQIGMTAPDIAGEDLDGVAFKLSDYRGKVVVLDFWGDW